jgi:hypothetical protein
VKKTVAIFLHHPTCSMESVNGVISALAPNFHIRVFTRHKVPSGFFDAVDMVVFPGGVGDDSAFVTLLKNNVDEIKTFLNRGGKYLGICMGAYWADSYYFGLLKDTRVVQYIKRPQADIKSSYATTVPIIWRREERRMFFYDGPTFVGGDFEKIATYANGDPMAIVQGSIGLIGCHLESEDSWYLKKNMRPYWHRGDHHRLLVQFVVDYLLEENQMALF